MGGSPRATPAGLLVLLLSCGGALLGCGSTPTDEGDARPDGDVEADESDAGVDADGDEAGPDGDAEGAPEGGPLSFLVTGLEVVPDRVCDVDGDGDLDNCIADLGEPAAGIVAMALNAFDDTRVFSRLGLLHLRWLDDLTVPRSEETTVLFLDGAARAGVGEDGGDAFWVTNLSVDSCAEPLYAFEGEVDDGLLSASAGAVRYDLIGTSLALGSPQLVGRIGPEGSDAEVHLCAVLPAREAGPIALEGTLSEHTLLELFVGGGAVMGLPGVPGATPDVDADDDGLESFLVDADGHLSTCVDGDFTVIEGRDCWQDDRIADGFSVTAALVTRVSRLLGPHPARRWALDHACDRPPSSESLWAPCQHHECARWTSRPCEGGCEGDSVEECAWDCAGHGPCRPVAEESRLLSSCADLVVEGGASCWLLGGAPTVGLVDGPWQARGGWLVEPITVGMGPVVVEGRALASPASSLEPEGGWGVVAYLGTEGAFLEPMDGHMGFNFGQRGYAAEWLFRNGEGAPPDRVVLRGAYGTGEYVPESHIGAATGPEVQPALDAGVAAPVAQRLRLIIAPDLPETEENELAVEAQFAGDGGEWSRGLACHGAGCLVQVRSGDVLRVGVYSGTYEDDARVELAGAEPLRVRALNSCP